MAAKTANLTAKARALGLPDDAVECVLRENGIHWWRRAKPRPEDEYTTPLTHQVCVVAECVRCGTFRYRGYNRWGTKSHPHYVWPDGYRELRAQVMEEMGDAETYGQAAARRYLVELGLVKPERVKT